MTDYGAGGDSCGSEDYDGGAGFETWDSDDVPDDDGAQTDYFGGAAVGSNGARGGADFSASYDGADLRPTITRP